jgi:PhnB protein
VKHAFEAEELGRMTNPDGSIGHAEFRIGDAIVMAFDAGPSWPETPAFLRLYVEEGDDVFRRALDAGATGVTAMTDLFFGDRVGRVRDPLGNIWWDPDQTRGRRRRRDAKTRERRALRQRDGVCPALAPRGHGWRVRHASALASRRRVRSGVGR